MPTTIVDLPNEILHMIFDYVGDDTEFFRRLSLSCRKIGPVAQARLFRHVRLTPTFNHLHTKKGTILECHEDERPIFFHRSLKENPTFRKYVHALHINFHVTVQWKKGEWEDSTDPRHWIHANSSDEADESLLNSFYWTALTELIQWSSAIRTFDLMIDGGLSRATSSLLMEHIPRMQHLQKLSYGLDSDSDSDRLMKILPQLEHLKALTLGHGDGVRPRHEWPMQPGWKLASLEELYIYGEHTARGWMNCLQHCPALKILELEEMFDDSFAEAIGSYLEVALLPVKSTLQRLSVGFAETLGYSQETDEVLMQSAGFQMNELPGLRELALNGYEFTYRELSKEGLHRSFIAKFDPWEEEQGLHHYVMNLGQRIRPLQEAIEMSHVQNLKLEFNVSAYDDIQALALMMQRFEGSGRNVFIGYGGVVP